MWQTISNRKSACRYSTCRNSRHTQQGSKLVPPDPWTFSEEIAEVLQIWTNCRAPCPVNLLGLGVACPDACANKSIKINLFLFNHKQDMWFLLFVWPRWGLPTVEDHRKSHQKVIYWALYMSLGRGNMGRGRLWDSEYRHRLQYLMVRTVSLNV